MRSTRAAAAVSRLNARSEGQHYTLSLTSSGLCKLRVRTDAGEQQVTEGLTLDEFVRVVNAMGPQQVARVTKSDAAFAKQLVKTPKT